MLQSADHSIDERRRRLQCVVMDVSEGRIERVSVSSVAVVIDVVFNYFLEHSKTFRKVSVLCKVSSCTDLIERTPGTL